MNREDINSLLEKFKKGTITKEEQVLLDEWYASFEINENYTEGMRKEEQMALRGSIWQDVRKAIDAEKEALSNRQNKRRWTKSWYMAASLSLGILLGYWLYYPLIKPVNYQTGLGEVLTVLLPDSTSVMLNGNSRLTYQPDWLGGFDRKVSLEGEAFFEVTHTEDHRRFSINQEKEMAVEVFGTAFTLHHRDAKSTVALQTGSVKVTLDRLEEEKKALFLKPGEVATYNSKEKGVEVLVPTNLESYSAWKEGKLVLDRSSLLEIIDRLRDSHGLDIKIEKNIVNSRRVSGTLPLHQDVKVLIQNLEQLFEVELDQ